VSALLDMARPPTLFDATVVDTPAAEPPGLAEPAVDAARTLASVIEGVWGELGAGRSVACPVCAEPMAPVYGARALPVGGRCGGCGTQLG
jgi:hypothetical protein